MTDAVLIVGGGVAGLTAAEICAAAGARSIVVERAAVVGGRLAAAMTDASADGGYRVPLPKFSRLGQRDDIEIVTLAELEGLSGRAGNFTATIRERARFVTDTCTRCNRCRAVCPSVSPNEYDAGLTYRKAIYTPLPQTLPARYAIDIESCLNKPPNYLPCDRCIAVCDDNSIHFDQPADVLHERNVGAVIVTTGFAVLDPGRLATSGYGVHPDVVTTAELQRLLMDPGPTGGFVARPSNEEYPESIMLIVDELTAFDLYTIADQVHRLVEQDIARIVLLLTVQPDPEAAAALGRALPAGIEVRWGLLREVVGAAGGGLEVSFAEFDSHRVPREPFDLVVLSAELGPAAGLGRLAQLVGCDLDAAGYVAQPDPAAPCATSQPGIFVAGGAGAPVSLADAVDQARGAAAAALAQLDPRLLQPGAVPELPAARPTAAEELARHEVRARIERALHALLGARD